MNLIALQEIYIHAKSLEDFLGKSSGTTADWPLEIKFDNKESADILTQMLNDLSISISKYEDSIKTT